MTETRTIIAGNLIVHPEQIDRAKRAFVAMQQATRAEPGCIHFSFSQDLTEPTHFRVFEDWRSSEALAEHMSTPHLAQLIQELEPVLTAPLGVTRYAVTDVSAESG